jgi:hypothetical protein
MAKKEMTWMDVIREQLNKMRKEGKHPSIGDVTPQAKKEWEDIKAGKHPLYIQGSSKGKSKSNSKSNKGKSNKNSSKSKSSNKKNKTSKIGKGANKGMKTRKMKGNAPSSSNMSIEQMLAKVKLCKKDSAKVMKYLKMSGNQKGGDCGCDKQSGGKKSKKGRKMKGGTSTSEAGTGASEAGTEAFEETIDTSSGENASEEAENDLTHEVVEKP